jgi:hypothetical protein
VPHPRLFLRALLPFVLHALARSADDALDVLLHSTLTLDLGSEVLRGLVSRGGATLGGVGGGLVAGVLAWLALGFQRARRDRLGLGAALGREAGSFDPLYLRPAITVLALISLGLQPVFPYAFTLPVALTQDWGIGQDVLALAWFVAARVTVPRLPAPRPGALWFMAFVAYALLTPEWARRWEGHPGNEPKYLRQAVAIGHDLSLDAEGVSAPMEELAPMPIGAALARAAVTIVGETRRMTEALFHGPAAVGKDAIRASKITRQTIRGKEGGVYYVLAPGPSILLAPTLRIDRAINRARGTPGRLAVSVLAWNALGAALVAAMFLLFRDATGSPGLAAALAAGFALTPPFLFYFFQFYPEMVGALLLALLFRSLAFRRSWTTHAALVFGLELVALPWLHQKFLPVWGVLAVTALAVLSRRRASRGAFVAILVPQVVGGFLTALYHFAITGSARPDALFLAWGPAGVTTERLGQGLLGLLLDARYGIVPYAPIYLLAAAGLAFALRERSPLLLALPAAAVYYATVAAADNWAGAVCNLGRYFMPVAPLAVALVGIALHRVLGRRGAVAVTLALVGWTALLAMALWRDPHAANDSAVLLARSAFADGHVYVPDLFIRRWSDATPGLPARVLAWTSGAVALAFFFHRATRDRDGTSPARASLGLAGLVVGVTLGLEQWPPRRSAPAFPGQATVDSASTAFVSGPVQEHDEALVAETGDVEILLRSPEPRSSVAVLVGGDGVFRGAGLGPVRARPAGVWLEVPLEPVAALQDRTGRRESLSRGRLTVEGEVVLRFGEKKGNSER